MNLSKETRELMSLGMLKLMNDIELSIVTSIAEEGVEDHLKETEMDEQWYAAIEALKHKLSLYEEGDTDEIIN